MNTARRIYLFSLSIFFLLSGFFASAQVNNPLINSGEVIKTGANLYSEKKFREAISEYSKISRSDTNYSNALYELSYNYYSDSQYLKSLENAKLGMDLFPHKYAIFGLLAAVATDEVNKKAESLALYDSALKRNPNAFLLHFNKGIVNYNAKNYEEAKRDLQKTLIINPYYSNAHFYLGNIYLFEGNLVPALMAYKSYLLISPSGSLYSNVINVMNDIAKVTDDVLGYVKNRKKSKTDDFSLQQDILLSKVALDRKYKLKADIEDNIVRQLQVVDEKLEYNTNDNGFAMQYYVPLYSNVIKDGNFEPMIFLAFSGVENKIIIDWNKKNKKEKQAFIDYASKYLDAIKATQILDFSQRKNSNLHHVYNEKNLVGKGMFSTGKDPVIVGKWEYFHPNGALKAVGTFNDKGNKEGSWTYYYENGALKEKINMSDGEQDGVSEGWFDNGNKWYWETYTKGKINGRQDIYYFNEKPRTIAFFKENLRNGEQKSFDIKGNLTATANYTDNKLDGLNKTFYPGGKLKTEVTYKSDEAEGAYKSYYQSGKIYQTGEYKGGKSQGLWTTYFEDGVVSTKTVYVDDEITGEFTEYFEDGTLKRKGTYYKKKIDGKDESFDDDGKLFSTEIYDKGRLREITFFDKAGAVISTTTTRKGAANITFYSPEGLKTSEGFFNKEGNKDGKFTFYFASGSKREESTWKDGVMQGQHTIYYPNGKISRTTNYKDGEEDGYVKDYYADGQLSSEGWKVTGSRQQHYLFYNNVGDLTSKEFYLNGELDGYTESLYPGNTRHIEYKYKNGWLEGMVQFDSTGKEIISESMLDKGKGQLVYKYFNGQNSSVGSYSNYMIHGKYTYYFFDGSLSATSYYKNDLRDSVYKSYYYGGTLKMEGSYKAGVKEGPWKYYYPNGKIKELENYVAGELESIDTQYMQDGSLEKVIPFKKGEIDGAYEIYGDNNQVAVRLIFKKGVVTGYDYKESGGKFVAPVSLKGANGKVLAKYPNGKPSASFTYLDNSLDGERKIFYSNGNIMTEGPILYGYANGKHKDYYPDGKPKNEETYVLGNLHGLCKYYYPDGRLEKEENFYDNDNHGVSKYYDTNGKLKKTHIYHYGLLQSVK